MKLILRKSDLAAALECAATKDIRFYLNAVCVEYVPGDENEGAGTLVFAGTDGAVLFAGTAPADWDGCEPAAEGFEVIIPRDAVKLAMKFVTQRFAKVPLEFLPGGKYQIGGIVFSAVDAKYPDFRFVIPATCSGEIGQFNPHLLARAEDALATYLGVKVTEMTLNHNGESAAVLRAATGDALAVITPRRHPGIKHEGHAIPARKQKAA